MGTLKERKEVIVMFRELFQGLVNIHFDELNRLRNELNRTAKKSK